MASPSIAVPPKSDFIHGLLEPWNQRMPNGMVTFAGNSIHYGTRPGREVLFMRSSGGWTVLEANDTSWPFDDKLFEGGRSWPPAWSDASERFYWTTFLISPFATRQDGKIYRWGAKPRELLQHIGNFTAQDGPPPLRGIFLDEAGAEYVIFPPGSLETVAAKAAGSVAKVLDWYFGDYEQITAPGEYLPLGPAFVTAKYAVYWAGKTDGTTVRARIARFDRQSQKEEILVGYGLQLLGEIVTGIQSMKVFRDEAVVVYTTCQGRSKSKPLGRRKRGPPTRRGARPQAEGEAVRGGVWSF